VQQVVVQQVVVQQVVVQQVVVQQAVVQQVERGRPGIHRLEVLQGAQVQPVGG
jgi:hypothetical protein